MKNIKYSKYEKFILRPHFLMYYIIRITKKMKYFSRSDRFYFDNVSVEYLFQVTVWWQWQKLLTNTGHKSNIVVPKGNMLGTKVKFYMKNGKGFAMPVPFYHKTTAGQESISWEILHQCGGLWCPPYS